MQARCHSPSAAVQALTGLLPTLAEISPPDKAMQNFWLGLLAAAAASGRSSSGALAEARGLMHAWEMSREEAGPQGRAAELVGQLLGLEAAQKALAGNQKQVDGTSWQFTCRQACVLSLGCSSPRVAGRCICVCEHLHSMQPGAAPLRRASVEPLLACSERLLKPLVCLPTACSIAGCLATVMQCMSWACHGTGLC